MRPGGSRPGGRRRRLDRFALAATGSALAHAAALAAALLWSGRAPAPPPAPEQGVEIVWDEASGEAVGEDAMPEPPGAPPSPPMPEAPEVPPSPDAAEQPRPPAPPPPAPRLAEAPSAPPPALDLPPGEALAPGLPAAPSVPEIPPAGEPEMPPAPPPEPQPALPPPQPARAPTARPGSQATAPGAKGVGRATGAVVPPGLDTSFRNAAPAYPEAARLRGEQGAVGLELSIDAEGRVLGAAVARSSGSPALDEAARRAVREWRFRPAQANGRAVPGTIRTTVHFRLS
ncbi:energy transducer TonB [Roseococcus sp.]|uniref:energy transducer TonB n=1 Tax=Roseococcus sp. TaxID=2109646 RepID=UPI003BA8AD01